MQIVILEKSRDTLMTFLTCNKRTETICLAWFHALMFVYRVHCYFNLSNIIFHLKLISVDFSKKKSSHSIPSNKLRKNEKKTAILLNFNVVFSLNHLSVMNEYLKKLKRNISKESTFRTLLVYYVGVYYESVKYFRKMLG